MSSFAEGFAKAFVPTFNAAIEEGNRSFDNKVAKGVELFKDNYPDYLETTQSANDRLRTAEQLVQEYNLPQEAVGNIHAWLGQGRGIEAIREDLQTGTLEAIPQPTGAPLPADDQMTTLGMSDDFEGFWGRVIQAESGGDPNALSDAGAMGVAQIMPATAMSPGFGIRNVFDVARELGVEVGQETPDEARRLLQNPEVNDTFGRGYMSSMLERYEGDREKALIAYNFSYGAADEYDGNRASLPEETRNYLDRIIGPRPEGQIQSGATNTPETSATTANRPEDTRSNEDTEELSWLERARRRAEQRVNDEILSTLGVSQEYYDAVVSGYRPEYNAPEIRMAFSPAKDPEDTPNWQDLSKVTSSNWRSFEAEARANGDTEQAEAIVALGQSIENADTPTYRDWSSMTSSNAEGRRVAAEAADDPAAVAIIDDFINGNRETPDYLDFGSLTTSNARGRAIAARRAGDTDAEAEITKFLEDNDDTFPDSITEGYIRAQYVQYASRAATGEEDDVAAFETWQRTELPILMNSLQLTEQDGGRPSSLTEAWQRVRELERSDESTEEQIQAARQDYEDLIALEENRSNARNSGDLVRFIRPTEDGGFESVQGGINRDGVQVDELGNPLEGDGWRRLGEREERELNSITTTLRSQISDYNTASLATTGALRLGGQIADLAVENPEALTNTAGIVRSLVSFGREVNTMTSVVSSMVGDRTGENDYTSLPDIENRLRQENVLDSGETLEGLAATPMSEVVQLGESAEGLARARSILEAKVLLMAFRAGGLEGQSGQAMSNKDFDRLIKIIQNSSNAETFITGLRGYLQDRVDNLSDRYRIVSPERVADLRVFENLYGYNPLVANGLVESPESLRNNPTDDRLARGFALLDGQIQASQSTTSSAPSGAVQFLRENPNTLQQFIDKYGENAVPEDMRSAN